MRLLRIVLAPILMSLLLADSAHAQWVYNGTRLSTYPGAYTTDAVSDGAGGAIIVWQDQRNLDNDIYIQRINSLGMPLWSNDGNPVCVQPDAQETPVLVSDGFSGAIVAWRDHRGATYDIYAQRINSTGAPVWPLNGVALCAALNDQLFPVITNDNTSGAIVAWADLRSGAGYDVYARRITGAGSVQWTADGVGIAVTTASQYLPRIMTDGAGGAFITWDDTRNGNNDIYAQRVNNLGVVQWTANGRPVIVTTGDQSRPQLVTDGSSGIILCWRDQRTNDDIFAQRLSPSGTQLWDPMGRTVCDDAGAQLSPQLVSDGAGGAVIAWEDYRNLEYDIFAQRIAPNGYPMWTTNGIAVSTAPDNQQQIRILSDGAQGAIIAWLDERADPITNIYAQRINFNGIPLWYPDGAGVCTATSGQGSLVATRDGNNGLIAAWSDGRGFNTIFAQRIETRYGYPGRPEPVIGSAVDNPSDQGGQVIVRWTASDLDNFSFPGVSYYSVWRSTDSVAFKAALQAQQVVGDPDQITKEFSGSAFWSDQAAAAPTYWEWVANLGASYQSRYSYTAPTRQDSTMASSPTTYFKVLVHEAPVAPTRIWESGVASARSVDNLAPAAPILLTIQQSGSNAVLTWSPVVAADLDKYTLYRAGSSGVQTIPINFLIDRTLPSFTDVGAAAGGYFYVVTAKDTHGNQSPPSNEVSLAGSTGIGNTPPIKTLTLEPNFPNPFSTRTELNIGVPADGDASVELYDVGGRRVLARDLGRLERGWRKVPLDAVTADGTQIANGVYLCRLRMNGATVTRKIAIVH
jgi:hypothetical protein